VIKMSASREELIDQLSEWIDTTVIAEQLVDAMAEVALPEEMTLAHAKATYYDFLQNELIDGLQRSAKRA
jgi:hypothetical protein